MHTDTSESIIRTIHDFIEEERRHNFCFLGKHAHRFMGHRDLLIVSLATCDDIRAALGHSGDVHPQEYTQDWYTFEEPKGNNPIHTVAIALTHGENLRIENLAICIPRRKPEPCFIRADAWLRETYNWDDEWDMRFTKMQYEKQQAWWKNNGQSFRIFDLPQELRDAVYLQMVGPVVLPDTHHGRVVIGKGLSYGSAERLGRNRDADIDRANMTVMRLEMSAAAYFASINIVPGHNDPFASQVGAFELRNLTRFPALRNLDFRFISPKHPGALCPWAKADGTSVHGAHACQKIWIDWLFTLAWRTLRTLGASHPVRYTLSGCVKTSTKLLWERLLNDAHTDQTVDMQAEEAMIRATHGPGECKCTTRCSRKEAGEGRVCVFTEYEIKAIDGLEQHVDDMYWRFED
ncbi:hypothetical protein SNOG_14418 [Parastagonospora nodorum SN15]|uniref:Uncharacterized protein n=1 Tax=Phaeosphaeria nodorum (strain SN15 / ATCC MYA-4574 / FGSC 10173) TaxID=321614 RepID=Q0U1N2_PHANO|nr:hypothetical protein SNOG_14418 [Parastagonospora nodorum SN15]EAT78289.2 hypothetical protein SNOG_14418 [Parastagonospora nodorum SN15]